MLKEVGFAFLGLLSTSDKVPFRLLTALDLYIEQVEQAEPAMSSGTFSAIRWESFNQWSCFSRRDIQPGLTSVTYGVTKRIPHLMYKERSLVKIFELPPENNYDYLAVLNRWSKLLRHSRYVCILAARLPPFMHTGTEDLYYVQLIKTERGYWNLDTQIVSRDDY